MTIHKFFPIKTETSCQLKWNWSTVSLYTGRTFSCCRSGASTFDQDNFDNFHNTDVKIKDRQQMLLGEWPDFGGCNYCSDYEAIGGFSKRNRHATIPYLTPRELDTDPSAVYVTPTILEVYFDNTCNLSCLYCKPEYSSVIDQENRRHGLFDQRGVKLEPFVIKPDYKKILEKFWIWMRANSQHLKRLNILGGEPFYQSQFDQCTEYFEENSHPDLEISIVTNLMVAPEKLDRWIERFKKMLSLRKIRRFDITCSIDCWGTDQEFVRSGLDLEMWEKNFETLLKHKWLTININQTISVLTIKTMPTLIEKLNQWRQQHVIGHWFATVRTPTWLSPTVLGPEIFEKEFETVLRLMPRDTDVNDGAWQLMNSFATTFKQSKRNPEELAKLKVFLDEKDRRRGTNWRQQFPWLNEELKNVV